MKNKHKKAVALKYELARGNAPKVTAKGRGELADRIIAVAREHGIPIHNDGDLVEVLSKLDLDQEIPPELYKAVASILAFIYRVNDNAKKR